MARIARVNFLGSPIIGRRAKNPSVWKEGSGHLQQRPCRANFWRSLANFWRREKGAVVCLQRSSLRYRAGPAGPSMKHTWPGRFVVFSFNWSRFAKRAFLPITSTSSWTQETKFIFWNSKKLAAFGKLQRSWLVSFASWTLLQLKRGARVQLHSLAARRKKRRWSQSATALFSSAFL